MNLSISVDTKINLSLWNTKPDICVEGVRIRTFLLVRTFSCISTEYGGLQSQFPYSLRIRRNADQTHPECKYFSRSWRQDIASLS